MPLVASSKNPSKEEESQNHPGGIRFGAEGTYEEDGFPNEQTEYLAELPLDTDNYNGGDDEDDDVIDEGRATRSHPSSLPAGIRMVRLHTHECHH